MGSLPSSVSLSGRRIDPPIDPALLARARSVAEEYGIVLRIQAGRYLGRGVEIASATGHGATPDECVKSTQDALTRAVAHMLLTGERPPDPGPAQAPAGGSTRLARVAIAIGWFACAAALAGIALIHVESVIVTGAGIAVVGFVTLVLGATARYAPAVTLGLANLGVCVLFILMVNAFDWSPDHARRPFLSMGTVYTIAYGLAALRAWRRAPKRSDPTKCEGCGYALFGLTTGRCPECGRPFDPRRVPVLPPGAG